MQNLYMIYIAWKDASYERGEKHPEEMGGPCKLHTVGMLVSDEGSRDYISVAMDYYESDGSYRHIEHIPRANITSCLKVPIEPYTANKTVGTP